MYIDITGESKNRGMDCLGSGTYFTGEMCACMGTGGYKWLENLPCFQGCQDWGCGE